MTNQSQRDKNTHLKVKSFENNRIIIEIFNFNAYRGEGTGDALKIGSYLKIEDGNEKSIVSVIQSFKMVEKGEEHDEIIQGDKPKGDFLLETFPIGQLELKNDKMRFKHGLKNISIPPSSVELLSSQELKVIFEKEDQPFKFAKHSSNNDIDIVVDGDKFFSKHLAVVGSTGSGKSCTVAKLLQVANNSQNEKIANTHVLLFDIHGEYDCAFNTKAKVISLEKNNLKLPYWLMNSEELEDFFLDNKEANSHNQVTQFKNAVIKNKDLHNPGKFITYDTPAYFNLQEVFNYLKNKNNETTYIKDNEEFYALKGKELKKTEEIDKEFWGELEFYQPTGNAKHKTLNHKVSKGYFFGEFSRFISRLETKLMDKRLNFILDTDYTKTDDFYAIIKNLLGYDSKFNIIILDLSSLPFEIVSLVVSIVSRYTFEFCYLKTKSSIKNDTPFLLVFEEAHKYIPKRNDLKFKNTRMAVERIAKEGRKYGVSCMIVSQRPSEISPTVFSQCNNFVVMRLTNPEDQGYVKKLLPESLDVYTDSLSILASREALLVGDALTTPCIAKINKAYPLPKSNSVKFLEEWRNDWQNIVFEDLYKMN